MEMDDDDVMSPIVGRRQILRRAGALGLLGFGLTQLAAGATRFPRLQTDDDELDVGDLLDDPTMQAVCTLTPSNALGPYYLNLNLVRSDIKESQAGQKTRLFIHVVHASDCSPIPNATVDVWHANALGVYSGFSNQGTQGQTWLRGRQFSDANGAVVFDTVFPGWYQGRTGHIHLLVRPTATTQLTTQLFFTQTLQNRVWSRQPYLSHTGNPTTNAQDGLYTSATVMSNLGLSPTYGLQLELTIGVA